MRKAEAAEGPKKPWEATIGTWCCCIGFAHMWGRQELHGRLGYPGFLLGHLVTWFNGHPNPSGIRTMCWGSAARPAWSWALEVGITLLPRINLGDCLTQLHYGRWKKNAIVLRDCCLESLPISSSYWRLEKKEDIFTCVGEGKGRGAVARNNKHLTVSGWMDN